VNLILFDSFEIDRPLSRRDRRAAHILEVLRRGPGETFDAGLVNGPRGKATVDEITSEALVLSFTWNNQQPPIEPLALVIGLPRPQTARDILRDATSLGVGAIHFVRTEKSEPSYARSTLWTSDEWRRQLLVGAEQAFATRIPDVTHNRSLSDALDALPSLSVRHALDNYEASSRLSDAPVDPGSLHILAVGGERGWSAVDREALRSHRFTLVSLGSRVLRTETAVVAALTVLRTRLGLM
jgi:RsmE family RNA methyltransferase